MANSIELQSGIIITQNMYIKLIVWWTQMSFFMRKYSILKRLQKEWTTIIVKQECILLE